MNRPAIMIRDIHHYGDDLTVPEPDCSVRFPALVLQVLVLLVAGTWLIRWFTAPTWSGFLTITSICVALLSCKSPTVPVANSFQEVAHAGQPSFSSNRGSKACIQRTTDSCTVSRRVMGLCSSQ